MQTPYTPYPPGQGYGPASAPPVDPIISRLRPRDMGGILDQSFRLYRANFLTFVAIVAVVFVPVEIISQALSISSQGNSRGAVTSFDPATGAFNSAFTQSMVTSLVLALALIVVTAIGSLLQYLSQGALTAGIADSYLEKPVSFDRSYKEMLKHLGPLLGVIGLQILIGVGIFGVPVLLFGLSFLGFANSLDNPSASGGSSAAICAAACLILPASLLSIYVFTRLRLVAPAVIIENLGPREALRRSWGLVLNNWWR